MALGDDVAGTAFALATLRGHSQFKLDFIEPHTRAGMASDVTVGDTAADTNDHGNQALGGGW